MAIITQSSGNFQKLVGLYENPLLEYWVNKYQKASENSLIGEFFDVVTSDNPTEAISEMVGSVDFTKWNGEFTYSDAKEGNTKVWTPVIWQAGRAYDRFTLSNAKLLNMKKDHGDFAIGAARCRNLCAAGIFTNADQTSFTVNGVSLAWTLTADGNPIAYTAHTSANYDTTQSNLGTNALNEANLEAACQAMFAFKDENGNDANMQPDTLVVPTYLRQTALELIGGAGKYNVSDNNPNIYFGSMKLIVWDYFKKQSSKAGYPWFVMDSVAAKESTKWINRLETGDEYDLISWKDEETQTWKVGSIMWFSAGSYDWRPYYFNIPA